MKGSEHNDEFLKDKKSGAIKTKTNFAGGILGGISNGEDIIIRVAVKPPSSIPKSQQTVDTRGRKRTITVEGRHDPCLCPRVVPVVESMISLVIVDHLLRQSLLKKETTSGFIRKEIDLLDDMLILLLSQRQELVREIGRWKKLHRHPIANPRREKEIMKKRFALLQDTGLDRKFIRDIYRIVFRESRTAQRLA